MAGSYHGGNKRNHTNPKRKRGNSSLTLRVGVRNIFAEVILPLPTVEDLIVLKAIANRPKDKVDIEGLLECTADLDYAFIRKHVDEFAQILEAPEIYNELDGRLRRHTKRNAKR